MILHFENFETAALFTAQRRSEGYFARTLDSGVSHLWGPLVVNGARVVVSPEPIVDEVPPAPPATKSRFVLPALNILVLAWVLGGLLILLGLALKSAQTPRVTSANPFDGLLGALIVTSVLCPLVSLFMIRVTRRDRLRQPGESLDPPMAIIAILLIL